MEQKELTRKQARKAAFAVAISAFIGFSGILFSPDTYQLSIFLPAILIAQILFFSPAGLLEATIIWFVVYFIFKRIINIFVFRILLIALCLAAVPLGFFSNVYLFRFITRTKPYMNQIDTNGDGKIDKWVYSNDNTGITVVELDTTGNGRPNIKQTYKRTKLIRTEEIISPKQR